MRAIWMVFVAVLALPAGTTAQVPGPERDRRAEMEQRVRRAFMERVTTRLELNEEQRDRVREILADGREARADLALETRALRIDLLQAVRDEETPMTEFETLLERLDAVRAREEEIRQAEEAALARVLDPRQRAVFLMLRMEFNERVRQMRGGRGPGGPVGPPGPGGSSPWV